MNIYTSLQTWKPSTEQPGARQTHSKSEPSCSPKKPQCHMEQEENSTPRISVATSEKSCYDGIGLFGRLKRCCSLVEDAKSYAESGRECYPVLVLTLQPMEPNSVIRPTSEQVPDVQITGELWLTKPAVITSCRLKWLSPYSFRDKPLSALKRASSTNAATCWTGT